MALALIQENTCIVTLKGGKGEDNASEKEHVKSYGTTSLIAVYPCVQFSIWWEETCDGHSCKKAISLQEEKKEKWDNWKTLLAVRRKRTHKRVQ